MVLIDSAVWPPNSCIQVPLVLAAKIMGAILIPCNSWLFFLRVRAVPSYPYSKVILAVCLALWASTFTSFLIFPGFRFTGFRISDTQCYFDTEYKTKLLCIPFIALVVFDTTMMLAISLGFVMHSADRTWSARVKSTMLMEHMGHLSKMFLRSGQIYYLSVVLISFSICPLSLTTV